MAKAKPKAQSKVKTEAKQGPGRPRKELDENLIESLASIGCTNEEIAGIAGCTEKTLAGNYYDLLKKGRNAAKMSLRRKQFQLAQTGDRTMLIWLGKQMLGQSEKVKQVTSTEEIKEYNPRYLEALRRAGMVMHDEHEKMLAEQREAGENDDEGPVDA